jgi:hypothetical protein
MTDARSPPSRIWHLAVFVLIGCHGAASENPTPRADTRANERASETKADERMASLEKGMASLQAKVDAQARQKHCFEVQRVTRAAWYEHDRTVLEFVATPCDEVAGACSDTGLPPRTFERYRLSISRMVGEADAPLDTLRARMGDLPKLPEATVRSDAVTRIRSTRDAAESATKAYLAECGPAEG